MKKLLTITALALLISSCATTHIPANCRITGSGSYKDNWRVCLECTQAEKAFKAEVQKRLEEQKNAKKK